MAEAAVAAGGATINVIQLGDVALLLCRNISNFINELKDAKDDIRHIRDDTPTSLQGEVLPDMLVKNFYHFHESMESIRGWLPPDLSPGFAEKFRFVFNRKTVKSATVRLEQCKSSTTLALSIINNRNGLKLRNSLGNLKVASEEMT
ncbi:uncharacterized protein F4822DRAFT_426625 [Hypoxylon trugodes]|uniref:uncharacterized protein n=1 Tax=Hypoxylon trugodes TaxID=326681 RepID=UPI00219759A0|nr:uncharacterized protein F4822DRAFT_426625 [Hypoxylon trugodes]KAI1390780.1 hypothetical protein F4822DRAFT_426625 [Hypoxylon trugodes]